MNIEINLVEVAAELADTDVQMKFNFNDEKIYVEDESGHFNYTDEAQDVFNNRYDYYYGFINDLKI